MRVVRALAGVAVTAGAALSWAAPVGAQAPRGSWTDPAPTGRFNDQPLAYLQEEQRLEGTAEFEDGISDVTFTLVEDAARVPDPCSAALTVRDQVAPVAGARANFSFEASFPCNRRYLVRATVRPVDRPLREEEPLRLDLWLGVAIPPLPAIDMVAEPLAAPARGVQLTWSGGGEEADFEGWEVRRAVGDGAFVAIGESGPQERTYADRDVPASATRVRYQVLGMRPGPEAGTTVYARQAVAAEATLPPTTATTTASGGTGTGTGAGTASGGGGRPVPGSAGPVVNGPRTTTTVDTGFQERLPFQPRAAAPAPVPSGSPNVVARLDDGDDGPGRRQTLLLVAGGSAAFVWFMALRLLNRRATAVV